MSSQSIVAVVLAVVLDVISNIEACGTVSNPSLVDVSISPGTIDTPNYPGLYPRLGTCYWLVQAAPSQTVGYSFETDFRLESSSSCRYDYVVLYDSNTAVNKIGKYCGSIRPSERMTTDRYLLISFRSDASAQYKGFRLNVASGEIPSAGHGVDPYEGRFVQLPLFFGSSFPVIIIIVCFCACCMKKHHTRSGRANITSTSTSCSSTTNNSTRITVINNNRIGPDARRTEVFPFGTGYRDSIDNGNVFAGPIYPPVPPAYQPPPPAYPPPAYGDVFPQGPQSPQGQQAAQGPGLQAHPGVHGSAVGVGYPNHPPPSYSAPL